MKGDLRIDQTWNNKVNQVQKLDSDDVKIKKFLNLNFIQSMSWQTLCLCDNSQKDLNHN